MKKRIIVIILILILILCFIPIPTEQTENGTQVHEALTYAIVEWHSDDGGYENTRFYWFPERGLDNLIKLEMELRSRV